MTLMPVIGRELRAEARHRGTYGLRVVGAATAVLVAFVLLFNWPFGLGLGSRLFHTLDGSLCLLIWTCVPFLVADCISRERREGTLGLLFLTPLRAWEIVVAKSLAHGLRSVTLVVAVLPTMTIPFLLGGTSLPEVAESCVRNLAAFLLAFAAGILASSVCRSRIRALLCAGSLGFFLAICFCAAVGLGMILGVPRFSSLSGLDFGRSVDVGLGLIVGSPDLRVYSIAFGPGGGKVNAWNLTRCMANVLVGSGLLWVAAIAFAGVNLKRYWQEEPPPARRLKFEKQFTTPIVGVATLQRLLRRSLDFNPIGWLALRTRSSRLIGWGWLAVIGALFIYYLGAAPFRMGETFQGPLTTLAVLLLGSIAMTAAGSFKRERETGLMELLLVTPLTVGQIIRGRLLAIWMQFLPCCALLVYVLLSLQSTVIDEGAGSLALFISTSCLTLPVVGLYFSLRQPSFMSAFLWTLVVGVAAPLLPMPAAWAVVEFTGVAGPPTQTFFWGLASTSLTFFLTWSALAQSLIGLGTGAQLYRNLKRRFAVDRS